VHRPRFAVVPEQDAARRLRRLLVRRKCTTEVLCGPESLAAVASHPEVDTVVAAIVGIAGLRSCLAAAASGKRLLLANKEALVIGGSTFMQTVEQGGATLLPVDSSTRPFISA
jgi:1-deoxy-D-xylulose-5-phosphate reductoisomerase